MGDKMRDDLLEILDDAILMTYNKGFKDAARGMADKYNLDYNDIIHDIENITKLNNYDPPKRGKK